MMSHDIFISYSSKQKSIADGVCHYLEENGFKCWMAPRDIAVGSEYGDLIEEAIKTSKVVVLVFSEAASISKWVKGEINVAFTEDKPILPFRIDETEIKGSFRVMLNQMHWIDAFPKYADRLPDLLNSICGLLGRQARKTNIQGGTKKGSETVGEKTNQCKRGTNIINGHEYVDLGLPSGTLWATCNVGANRSEDYGNYYAWAETSTKRTYGWKRYKYGSGNLLNRLQDNPKLIKYCSQSKFGKNGFMDQLTTLQRGDDPAALWGSCWRTPTRAQWEELQENTTHLWTIKNGVNGGLFASKNNDQTLFLPAAGYRWRSRYDYAGYWGFYWSSSLNSGSPIYAYTFRFDSGGCYMFGYYRNGGLSVRAVHSPHQN